MGQYHKVYNIDKQEYINPHGLNNGLKLLEQVGHDLSTSTALFLLLANSNGRGGGDVRDHDLVGAWAGDKVVVQGDYATELDKGFVSDREIEGYKDISNDVFNMLRSTMEGI